MKIVDPALHQIRVEAILQHARHLFAAKGFAETSMDDIAQACGIQKASLYHYFDSKQRILQEMVNLENSRWAAILKGTEETTSLRQTLAHLAAQFLQALDDPGRREFFKIIQFESHKNPSIQKALKESPTHNREGFYAVFEKYLGRALPRVKIAMFIRQFMGALIHHGNMTKLRGESFQAEKFPDAEYVGQLVDIFVKGIGEK
jgi:AcrR family transcriptional regulator